MLPIGTQPAGYHPDELATAIHVAAYECAPNVAPVVIVSRRVASGARAVSPP